MKNAIKLTLLILVSSIFILGCKKEEVKSEPNLKTVVNPANRSNPYDTVGYQHNQLLDDFIIIELIPKKSYYNVDSTFNNFGFSTAQKQFVLDMENYQHSDTSAYSNDLMELYYNCPEYFEKVFDIRDIVINTALGLEEKIENIKTIESGFSSLNISRYYIEMLYKTASTARYSLYYWAPTSQGGLGNFDTYFGNKKSTMEVNWGEVGLDDLWGAWGSALFTGNPFIALGGGVVASVITVVREVI